MPRHSTKVSRICLYCCQPFLAHPSLIRRKNGAVFCGVSCRGLHKRRPPEFRFWDQVSIGTDLECWVWQGQTNDKGYGVFRASIDPCGPKEYAHRFAWINKFGPIPDGLHVLHDCPAGDNPSCVNPAHLWLGTNNDNVADMVAKGRNQKGEQCHKSKLTKDQVCLIREKYDPPKIMAKHLAEELGVTVGCITAILRRQNWKHV